MPFDPRFAMNADPRCACVLLLDTSGSMQGAPIAALNEGLKAFETDIKQDALAQRRLEIAIVTFGTGVHKVQDFVTAGSFWAPTLSADGTTPMGQAIKTGLQMVQEQSQLYKDNGVARYRPWMVMITDGAPTDEWQSAATQARAETAAKRLAFYAVGVAGADMKVLKAVTDNAMMLAGLKFRDLFLWLSASQKSVSRSRVDEQVPLPDAGVFTV